MKTGVFSWEGLLALRQRKRPLIAGIVNVTPDSFSDGKGRIDPAERINFALQLLTEGADMIDLGAESTRPGAAEIPAAEEWKRLEPILPGILSAEPNAVISIDTRHAATAEKALQAGAKIINDVSGLAFDDPMAEVIARYHAGCILTHAVGTPETMQKNGTVIAADTLETVENGLQAILAYAEKQDILPRQIMLDAGIGFGKTRAGNYELLRNAGNLEKRFALPFCWGVSRKSLLKSEPDTMAKRVAGSLALAVKLAEQGVSLLRVHDVAMTVAALNAAAEMADLP